VQLIQHQQNIVQMIQRVLLIVFTVHCSSAPEHHPPNEYIKKQLSIYSHIK